jgi:SpoVK/Ycf46/Vps4 family AAA+-type ATPase
LSTQIRLLFGDPINAEKPGEADREWIVSHLEVYNCRELPADVREGLSGKSIEEIVRICKDPEPTLSTKDSTIPDVKWEDIGGLAAAKQDIIDTVQLPL